MAPDIAFLSAQTSLFSGLAFLIVVFIWIRNRREIALLPLGLGLLAFCVSGVGVLLGLPSLLPPLLLTAGLLLLHWSTHQSRPGIVLSGLLLLVFVSHFLILLITEPGYSPREAASSLVWAGLSLVTASSLISREEPSFRGRRLALFGLFGFHALFYIGVTSAYQLGLVVPGREESSTLFLVQQTELSVFSVLLVAVMVFGRLLERLQCLEDELRRRSENTPLPVCSSCRKVRDQDEAWSGMETYFQKHLALTFTHGICPECADVLYPGVSTSSVVPRSVKRRVSNHPFPVPLMETDRGSRELAQAE